MITETGTDLHDGLVYRLSGRYADFKHTSSRLYHFTALDGRPAEIELKENSRDDICVYIHHNTKDAYMPYSGDDALFRVMQFIIHTLGED